MKHCTYFVFNLTEFPVFAGGSITKSLLMVSAVVTSFTAEKKRSLTKDIAE